MEEKQEFMEIQYRLLDQEEIDEIRKDILRSPLMEFAFRYDDPEVGPIEFVYIDEGDADEGNHRVGVATLGDKEPSSEGALTEYAIKVITTLVTSDQVQQADADS